MVRYDANNQYYAINYLDGDKEDFDEEGVRRYCKLKQRYMDKRRDPRALEARGHLGTAFAHHLPPAPKQQNAPANNETNKPNC